MKVPEFLKEAMKPKLNEETYNYLTERIKFLAKKLDEVEDGEEFKALYYISELSRVCRGWTEVFDWTDERWIAFAKTLSFESGNTVGLPLKKGKNCPQCGLTPLVDQYCPTCEKFVVFRHTTNYPSPVLQVTEELIITSDK